MILIAPIFAVSGFAEKPSLPASWLNRIQAQRKSLDRVEAELESWQFELRDATSAVSYEQGESLLLKIPDLLLEPELDLDRTDSIISRLASEIRTLLGIDVKVADARAEIHQRDSNAGFYRVWDRMTGSLSIFDQRGIWNQDEQELSMGPPPSKAEIEIYLARLGLLIPSEATTEEILSSTPTDAAAELVFRLDLEGSRFRIGCRPWSGSGLVTSLIESSLWDEKEQGYLEKRAWYSWPVIGPRESKEGFPAAPLIGVELQYHSNTSIQDISVLILRSVKLDLGTWSSFPGERPPFGWTILDYRFTPETESRFGVDSP